MHITSEDDVKEASVLSGDEFEEKSEVPSNEQDSVLLARRESMALRLLRVFLALILISSTALASWLVFRFMRRAEQNTFLYEFANFADKVIHELRANAARRVQGVDALGVALTSYAKSVDAKWPLVTVPDFDILAASTRAIANATFAFMYPIVTSSERSSWEKYSVKNRAWIYEKPLNWENATTSLGNSSSTGGNRRLEILSRLLANTASGRRSVNGDSLPTFSSGISDEIYEFTKDGPRKSEGPGPFLPFWQMSPPDAIPPIAINFNAISLPDIESSMRAALNSKQAVLSELQDYNVSKGDYKNYGQNFARKPLAEPYSNIVYPVFDTFNRNRSLVAILLMDFTWGAILRGILPHGANGVDTVVENACNQTMTYRINGPDVMYLGAGDLHDRSFDGLEVVLTLNQGFTGGPNGVEMNTQYCPYTVRVYPSHALYEAYITTKPIIITVIVVAVFAFTSLVFFTYDRLVETRQTKVMQTAVRTNRIVSSLFPSNVRDRLFQINEPIRPEGNAQRRVKQNFNKADGPRTIELMPKNRLSTYLSSKREGGSETIDLIMEFSSTKPIADLFPSSTVLFADISGFTAWSSAREPSQVFTLLESVYSAFDKIAKRKGVFKVETIGDCYMAVTGLPEPQEQHAVIMAQFAQDCLVKMNEVTKELEVVLGPDTADLSVRIGIHSGPVTAGVLRSEKSRFQLFGDTVNTASRMESTGQKGKIQISQETANLLSAAGKDNWIAAREDKVFAKGKGDLQTFWLDPRGATHLIGRSGPEVLINTASLSSSNYFPARSSRGLLESETPWVGNSSHENQSKLKRLIQWNTEVLFRPLKAVVACRDPNLRLCSENKNFQGASTRVGTIENSGIESLRLLDEVVEVIKLSPFDRRRARRMFDTNAIKVNPQVSAQLLDFVSSIASLYQDNPFHNFEHASHVTMSANKLLQRVVALEDAEFSETASTKNMRLLGVSDLHKSTFGIASNPLVHFAILFAALVHDVDHPGVPNRKLVELNTDLAKRYQNKSVAEQNSVDIAWKLLMAPRYDELRKCIALSEEELRRFRQLVVNLVMATDVLDHELQELRTSRWEKAFPCNSSDNAECLSSADVANTKATIVIEHLIQASDVAHTMQHWQMFVKWNERLFREIYLRYISDGGDTDPSTIWYQRELDFFDRYVIPLAKKLRDCGVFGVAADEYLTYATENRSEWAQKGESVVHAMVERCRKEVGKTQSLGGTP